MKEQIQKLLKENNMTRVALAKKIGVSEGAIRKWEENGINNIKIKNAKSLAKFLNVPVVELLGLVQEEELEVLKLANRLSKASNKTKLMINAMLNVEDILK